VQPSSAQVRVSPKARTIGSAPAARLPLRLSTTMLGLFPHPSRANSSRPGHTSPVGLAGVASGRLPPAGSSSHVVLVDTDGLGWLGVARRAQPHWADAWSAAGPAQIGGQVAGCTGPASPRVARPSIPAREVAWTRASCLPGVGGSSVSLTCSCADQGGCHVDMVVGADHRGRSGVGVRRDAKPSPLTAPLPARSRLALLLDQAVGLAAGPVRPGPAGTADHPALPGPTGSGTSRGWGQCRSVTASSSLLEGRVVRLRAATPRSVLAWRAAAATASRSR
jgi:hypothetical protein